MIKTEKPKKKFTAAQLVRVSDLGHVVGGLDATRQKVLLVIEYKP